MHFYFIGQKIDGARSPLLWNAVFENLSLPHEMVPLEIKTNELRSFIMTKLSNSEKCGFGITNPFKSTFVSLCREFFEKSEYSERFTIPACNLFYWDSSQRPSVVNTDIFGIEESLANECKVGLWDQNVVILGNGGVVDGLLYRWSELHRDETNPRVSVFARRNLSKYEERYGLVCRPLDELARGLSQQCIVINCMDLTDNQPDSWFRSISKDLRGSSSQEIIFVDMQYRPRESYLSEFFFNLNAQVISGKTVNHWQACQALALVIGKPIDQRYISDVIRQLAL